MKNFKLILLVSALISMFWFEACKDKAISPEAQQANLLSSTWYIGNEGTVRINGNDVTSYFSDFQLTIISDKSYSTMGSNTPSPWPTAGTWEFVQNSDGNMILNKIIRNDGLVMVIEELTETSLTLSFVHDELVHESGRNESVTGEYLFVLKKL